MTVDVLFAWREPLAPDWRAQLANCANQASVIDGAAAGRLRRLASMRLESRERLQLRRLTKRLRELASAPPGFQSVRLLLVSNRTLSFFAGDLEAAGVARGLLIETYESEYDSVQSLAMGARAPLDPQVDAVLLLLDAEFLRADGALLDAAEEAESATRHRLEVGHVLDGLRSRFQVPVIVGTIPDPPDAQVSSSDRVIAGSQVRLVQSINQALAEFAHDGRAILFDLAALAARIGTMAFFDPVRSFQAKTPFSFEASPAVADALAALIAAMAGKSARALVLDLDNTLWGGVVADDGLAGIVVGRGSPEGEAYLDVQRYAMELRRRGVVLAACSKNLEEIAREPFKSHPDMLLREEHLSVLLAGFDDKATNIARIAEALDLDPSSVALLDDNPAERERVRSALPWVMVPEVGEDPAYFARALASSGFFEHLGLVKEDLGRAVAYQARAQAKALRHEIGDYDAYLRSLEMVLTISPFDDIGRARIAQLVQKSNQFNLTTKRYSEAEIATFQADPSYVAWQVRLKDRFADHGMISVLVADARAPDWAIDNWVMSCRVLERGVEATIINELARLALTAGARSLGGAYRPTARNSLVRELYDRLGFACEAVAEDGERRYRLDLASAALAPTRIEVAGGAAA